MLNILYTVIIYPLVQIIEFVFKAGDKIFANTGLSIIGVSLAVTFLCLPLYIIAEKWQNIERESIMRLKPKIDKIKAVFKGDEQYMIISTFYRQNHYHPLYAMRNSFGILIQVPFFIAAYTFLSHLQILNDPSFYFIRDLGAPDGLLTIGGTSFNILPILMTAINWIAGAIYTKNLYLKDKIQIYGLAAVFLALLYNSPAGLVLYWTMNNVFSLIKNIFLLLKRPLHVLYIILCTAVLFLDVYLIFFHHGNLSKRSILIIATFIIPLIPLLYKLYNWMYTAILKPLYTDKQSQTQLLVISLAVICLLTGFVIPSFVIVSSPQEFSYIESVTSPFSFLRNSFFQAFGFFVFWPVCIYFLFGKKIKTLLVLLAVCAGLGALINTFCFSGEYGELSSMLTFSNAGIIRPTFGIALGNIAIMILLAALIIFIVYINKVKIIIAYSSIIALALVGISTVHSATISREFSRYTAIRTTTDESVSITPIFQLSRDGKNVIVIMLDRAANGFLPEIFSESPELYKQFSGFVYYPNTLSFNSFTLIGIPPLFGGYEYTPEAINRRTEETLVHKHNEALLLMPIVFTANDFAVTVTDPPWANYSWIPDTRIFNEYSEINVRSTIRTYTDIWLAKNNFPDLQLKSSTLQRNFIWFSLFKSAPLALRDVIYNNGDWWSTDVAAIDFRQLLNSYAALDFLPLLTGADALKQNTFTILVNELTHEPTFLQAPDYVPSPTVTDRGNSLYADNVYYHANAAALKRLGTWFEFLKQNGLYDNTRLIIAADHGADIETGALPISEKIPINREAYNPLLMVKDFNADFPLQTVVTFMTNADVPSLAFKDLIPNPLNPFTGNLITDKQKQEPLRITTSTKWMPYEHNSNTYKISGNEWYTVHSDIFNADNWQKSEK
jgi:YidC/Oxa1 family membrane protein insertase